MLTTASRLRVQEILQRIAMGKKVSLDERIYVNKFASRDQNVSSWLRKATNYQQKKHSFDSIDKLLNELGICESDPHSTFNPNQDDLGEWFSGAPSWIRKS